MEQSGKNDPNLFSEQVNIKEKRKLKALHNDKQSVWSGIGMFGMVGWTIAVPTLVGVAVGIGLDKNHPESFSWTLSCLILGLFIGCLIAWHWVTKEHKDMNENNDNE
jgi:ATP synthase protein I